MMGIGRGGEMGFDVVELKLDKRLRGGEGGGGGG